MSKENQRVSISKRLLKEGLLKLLNEKSINYITITELCQTASINRTTFYRHYQTPSDVLNELKFDFIQYFYEVSLSFKKTNDMNQCMVELCHFLCRNKDIVRLFLSNDSDTEFTYLLETFTKKFLTDYTIFYKEKPVDENTLKLIITFWTHGIYALIYQWFMEDIPKTPEEIADLIVNSFYKDLSIQQTL